MEILRVIRPGPYTTVQDAGRFGYQRFGVPPSGALDPFAYRASNMLVGNPEGAAVLEITFMGPELEVLGEADMALTGAGMKVSVNGRNLAGWTSFRVKEGDRVVIGPALSGCRAFLSVTGGIDVPPVMGSRSCYAGAGIGGHRGRALAPEDILSRGEGALPAGPLAMPEEWIPRYSPDIILRAVPGPQDDFFTDGLRIFFESGFRVAPDSNRMGYRLVGPVIPHREGMPRSIISEPSVRGGVQIPAGGQPIILLVEQTVGGYTKIATVLSADIPLVAQARPGDRVRFMRVSLEEAHRAYSEQEEIIGRMSNYFSRRP